jgi:hypothetical protein
VTVELTGLASQSAYLAVPAVLLAGITVALFFGRGEPFGTLNDLFSAVALLLLIPPVLGVREKLGDAPGGWLLPLTIATVLGLALAGFGQMLLIVRVIDLSASFVTGGLGILPVLAWVAGLAWLSLGRQLLPTSLGWLSVLLLGAAILVAIFSGLKVGVATWASATILVAALLGWLVALAMAVQPGGPGPAVP